MKLEREKGDLPNQISRLERELKENEEELLNTEKRSKIYQKERGITEMEIKALEGKQKKYQLQLFEVKNNREYDAVTHEMEAVKLNIENQENRVIELIDLEEETQQSLKQLRESTEQLKKQLDEKKRALKQRLEKTEKREAELNHKRETLIRNLRPQVAATYERIRKAKNGLAVVPVIRDACGGCFKTLPPQRRLEIRQKNRLFICEVCGRLLVWDDRQSGNS
jgi:predicted  nucleic acid-binding Zn-ribbon protein